MGNLVSVSISVDQIISCCWDSTAGCATYILCLEERVEDLKNAVRELTALRNDVTRKVDIEESQQLKRLDRVDVWLTRVSQLEADAEKLITSCTTLESKCLGGCCPKNCKASYKLGRKVAKMLDDVAVLNSKGAFEELTAPLPPPPGQIRPDEPTVGLESLVDKVWNHVTDERTRIIGLYGMGGVGKTTLLNQLNNKLLEPTTDYDLVIWVVISKDLNLENVQNKLGEKIGFSGDKWMNKSPDDKAADILSVLSKKKFVLLLDDIWERVELSEIGVPVHNTRKVSKVIFTTRSEDVCSRMEAHKKIKVECLGWDDAWKLFEEKVGKDALSIHPDIPNLAQVVAKECDGLPLALIIIGRAMACKRAPQEWRHAIEVLRKSASEFSGMGDKVYPLLKFSYDNLSSNMLKSCFLYCTLFPEDYFISKTDLIYYWIGEGFLDGSNDTSVAQNQGYDIIGTLVYACLLEEEEEDDDYVKMHDVTRDMALWIANNCGEVRKNYLASAGAQLVEAPKAEEWKGVKRMSLMGNRISKLIDAPECSGLLTLLLGHNRLDEMDDYFFDFMPELRVLDLQMNEMLVQLPVSIRKLSSLKYLNLSHTKFKFLPVELKTLIRLKYLNLEGVCLHEIPPGLISSLSGLKVLLLKQCGVQIVSRINNVLPTDSEEFLMELLQLNDLSNLSITIRCNFGLRTLMYFSKLLNCIQDLSLKNFEGSYSINIPLENMKHLHTLEINHCDELKELNIDCTSPERETHQVKSLFPTISQRCFHSLRIVGIFNSNLMELTWIVFAPNLAKLTIMECGMMEQVIRENHKDIASEEVLSDINLFAKLEFLVLFYLSSLRTIYLNPLKFPCLKEIYVQDCPNLKELPLDSNSSCQSQVIIEAKKTWWNELKWKDETTRIAFSSSLREIEF